MIWFVVLAAALTVGAVAAVAVPLLRSGRGASRPAPWAALGAAGVLVVGSALLYVALSNWPWHAEPAADSPQAMVAHLARRLERSPDDLQGWLMLGRSYTALEQYPLAARAFRRAERLAGGRNVEALLGEAEALALGDESELDRRAGRLVEQALALDPNSGQALFFGAAAALRRSDLPLARARFAKLLTLNPPDNIKPLLQRQIAAIDQQLGNPSGPAPADRSGGAASEPGTAAAATGAAAAQSSAPTVRVLVGLSPRLAEYVPTGAPLFVFVRDPASPGPPLAVKRLTSQFPQSVELSAADSVIPGRQLIAGTSVEVVARVALSGNPLGATGDLVGRVVYRVGQDSRLDLVIDARMP